MLFAVSGAGEACSIGGMINTRGRSCGVQAWAVALMGWLLAPLAIVGAEWQPLFDGKTLSGWEVTGFAGHGDVEVTDGAIVLNQGILTGIHRAKPPATVDYEIALEARRVTGGDFFCGLTFPVKDSHATLVVGGWGGAVVGISSIDGLDASQNETTQYKKFEGGRWYKVRVAVTSTNLSAWIDEERVANVATTGKKVALRPGEIEMSAPLGIATWSTTGELRDIRWRPLGEAAAKGATAVAPALPPRFSVAADQIVARATNSHRAWERLAELCDRFGPRYAGTTNLEAAIDWILSEMKRDGLDAVRGEPVEVTHWVRGRESVEMVAPHVEALPMLGLGGSVGTGPGGITAPALVVASFEELERRATEAQGKIVVFNAPFTSYGETVRFRWAGANAASRAGAVASLVRSVGSFSLRTPHTGGMRYEPGVRPIPHAAIASEDAERLGRWQRRGVTPVLRMRMEATNLPPARSRNVLGEIRGSTAPEEVVVVGGHVDSWDVGRGALDDGGGCIAAWEALRILRELGLRPRRTIRCVLWTDEENGVVGGKAYRDAHKHEAARHVLAVESDNGAFNPVGYGFTGSDAARGIMDAIGGLAATRLGMGKVTKGGADADTGPLLEEGVPVASLRVAGEKYFWFHHTDADTPDKVDPDALNRCAAALAILAYSVADLEEALPR